MADQLIRAGEFDVVVAGGMESMTQAPYLLPKGRSGYRYGNAEILDATFHDGLFDAFDKEAMGESTEKHNDKFGFTREEQDEYAARSHELAAAAIKEGRFADEIVAGAGPAAQGRPDPHQRGRGRAPGHDDRVARQAQARLPQGRHHHRRQRLADLRRRRRRRRDEPRRRRAPRRHRPDPGRGRRARRRRRPDNSLQLQPANAIRAAVAKSDVALEDLKAIEVNEAFAAVGLASQKDLGLGNDVFNPERRAPSPSATRSAPRARAWRSPSSTSSSAAGGGAGAAALCGGGGQGDALILHVPAQ
jgi:acetyl-CoA C-acetyltransferase